MPDDTESSFWKLFFLIRGTGPNTLVPIRFPCLSTKTTELGKEPDMLIEVPRAPLNQYSNSEPYNLAHNKV